MVLRILNKATLRTLLLCLLLLAVLNKISAQIPEFFDANNKTAISSLMSASIDEDVQAVKFFIKYSPAIINQKNIGGATALHIISRKGNLEICKILIKNGANIDVIDNEGWTPLMRAITSKNSDLVKFLLDHGADINKLNSVGESPIIISATSECSECLDQVLSNYKLGDNFSIDNFKNQLNKSLQIANDRNDVLSRSILEKHINVVNKNTSSKNINSIGNEKEFSNKVVTIDILPELIQSSQTGDFINKGDKDISNKVVTIDILPELIQSSQTGDFINKGDKDISNKMVTIDILPELIQSSQTGDFINKGDKDISNKVYILEDSNDKHNKKVFIFSDTNESLPLKHFAQKKISINQNDNQNYIIKQITYKFLGTTIFGNKMRQSTTKLLKSTSEQNVANKEDKPVSSKAFIIDESNNGDKKKFIFNGINKALSSKQPYPHTSIKHEDTKSKTHLPITNSIDNIRDLEKPIYKFLGKTIKTFKPIN
jgi:ankyrin repeat protein